MIVSRPPAKVRLRKAHHLLARERPAAIGGLRQRAEEVLAGIRLGAVELRVQIIFQHRALFELAAGDLEDVNAPADPGVRLRLGHVEQVGERARLHGQRELIHDLDRTRGRAPR